MTSDQTEIPIETPAEPSVVLASPPEDVASPPETLRKPSRGNSSFTVMVELPFRFTGWYGCCTAYAAELWQDERGTFVDYEHSDSCDVWLHL